VPVVQDRPPPYEDEIRPDGTASYAYRGVDPDHRDNVGLRTALRRGTPLIYFHSLVPGRYYAHWPVFVVGDDRTALRFTTALDDAATVSPGHGLVAGRAQQGGVQVEGL
jgi:putative restriction endonuclease